MPTLHQWRSFYDTWAQRDPNVASTGEPLPTPEFARLGEVISGWLQLRGDEHALDVGCASGTLTSHWAGKTRSAIGVDFSERLIAVAQQRHGSERLRFQTAEAAALPFPDHSFDAVSCYNVLLSLPDHEYVARAIAELQRVARPGARILLGSLPDQRRQQPFFELLRSQAPWWRRLGSRIKSWLRPRRPRRTAILWFDIEALATRLRNDGWQVEIHDDPPFANYRYYRQSLVIQRTRGSKA
jgi:SAM-dependent methyltransferase